MPLPLRVWTFPAHRRLARQEHKKVDAAQGGENGICILASGSEWRAHRKWESHTCNEKPVYGCFVAFPRDLHACFPTPYMVREGGTPGSRALDDLTDLLLMLLTLNAICAEAVTFRLCACKAKKDLTY